MNVFLKESMNNKMRYNNIEYNIHWDYIFETSSKTVIPNKTICSLK